MADQQYRYRIYFNGKLQKSMPCTFLKGMTWLNNAELEWRKPENSNHIVRSEKELFILTTENNQLRIVVVDIKRHWDSLMS